MAKDAPNAERRAQDRSCDAGAAGHRPARRHFRHPVVGAPRRIRRRTWRRHTCTRQPSIGGWQRNRRARRVTRRRDLGRCSTRQRRRHRDALDLEDGGQRGAAPSARGPVQLGVELATRTLTHDAPPATSLTLVRAIGVRRAKVQRASGGSSPNLCPKYSIASSGRGCTNKPSASAVSVSPA